MKTTSFIKLLALFFVFGFAGHAIAQQKTVDTKELQEQMKKAQDLINQQLTPEQKAMVQKQLQKAQGMATYGSVQATMASKGAILDTGIDLNKKMPDPSAVLQNASAGLQKNMAILQKIQQQTHADVNKGLPTQGTTGFSAIPVSSKALIKNYARLMLADVTPKLNQLNAGLKYALDQVLRDTTITPQAQGMLLRSKGSPAEAVQYCVAKGVLSEPDNPWAANALGIIMRDAGRNKEAVQCYTYAYAIHPCPLLRCNMAWAVFYFGDFNTAKTYFNSVLSTLPDYAAAWEGLGMIAYKQGDIGKLFECMRHQVKTAGPDGDDGPGDDLVRFCGQVTNDQKMANIGQQPEGSPNPMQDNSLDDNSGEDADNQDPPPTADSEYPTFPSMGGIFAQDINGLTDAIKETPDYLNSIKKAKQQSDDRVKSIRAGLSKMVEKPYVDDQGMQVTPARYSKFVNQFYGVETLFAARVTYVASEYYNDWQKLMKSIAAQSLAFNDYVVATYKQAGPGHTGAYDDTLMCMMRPRARTEIGSSFASASFIFTKHFKELKNQIDWFISASTPSIKRMHKPDWNEYMNAMREDDIRQAVLRLYDTWVHTQAACYVPAEAVIAFNKGICTTELRMMDDGTGGSGPKPTTETLKPYKTKPGPCSNDGTMAIHKDYDYLKVDRDCNGTRVGIYPFVRSASGSAGGGGVSASGSATARLGFVLEHLNATATHDAYNNIGTTVNVTASAKLTGDVSENLGPVSGSAHAGAEVNANADFDSCWRYKDDGTFIGKTKTADFDVSIKVDGKLSMNAPIVGERNVSSSWEAEAHGKIDAVAQGDSGYQVTESNFGYSTTGH